MEAKSVYVSSNCNQTPTGADCNENHLLAYGSCHAVLIYDLNAARVVQTLIGHTKRVNSVRWIRGSDGELVSGASDGSVVVWKPQGGAHARFILPAGGPTVNIVDGWSCNGRTIIAGAAMEPGVVRIWTRDAPGGEFRPSETCRIGRSLCMGLRLGGSATSPLLACALEDSKILLLTETDRQVWIKGSVLSGHEDWVRGLDFALNGQGELLLASSSQDSTVRIWKLPEGGEAQLEAVLAGHEGWVYSVHWGPQAAQLLSASIDNSLIIWEPDEASGLWLESARLGEVGGNVLGFYGGAFSGNRVVAHSYHGAFHIWAQDAGGRWAPASKVGGHFDAIADLAWDPRGAFVYTAGADQTVRIHGPWEGGWAEFGRPQVHGYDMNAVAVIGRFQYASGADEKIVRVFQASDGALTGPKGAAVPSLGLSNKALPVDRVADAPSGEAPGWLAQGCRNLPVGHRELAADPGVDRPQADGGPDAVRPAVQAPAGRVQGQNVVAAPQGGGRPLHFGGLQRGAPPGAFPDRLELRLDARLPLLRHRVEGREARPLGGGGWEGAGGAVDGGYFCAIGLEAGTIDFYAFKGLRSERLLHLPQGAAHHLSVRRLAFRPQGGAPGELQLCSGGADSLLRIYRLIFANSIIKD
ncbi:hypothetical protein D910_03965 [Dendroctonus ponderosae]|uniref:Elongator complex protein 2 n=1 Tax=Dendroctonus ponderosae TaxID=77166 RepID=U4U2L4_DENPD|nr:hypothetical protein D910_03965 [Dendroctonus ponderosae]